LSTNLKSASKLPLEVDVPFWYGTIAAPSSAPGTTAGGTFADAVMAVADAVTVMSYRNTATGPNSIVDVGTDMLTRAQTAGKPVRLGAETNATPGCAYRSFVGLTDFQLETAVDQVEAAVDGYQTFRGMAIEDYNGWSVLAP
jgi:hypothetical protein